AGHEPGGSRFPERVLSRRDREPVSAARSRPELLGRPRNVGTQRAGVKRMSASDSTLDALLTPSAFGPLRLALGRAQYLHYRLFRKKRHDTFALEEVCGAPLVIAPGVLNPRLMRTGDFLAAQLETQLGERDAEVL